MLAKVETLKITLITTKPVKMKQYQVPLHPRDPDDKEAKIWRTLASWRDQVLLSAAPGQSSLRQTAVSGHVESSGELMN